MRAGLKAILETNPEFAIVGEAENGIDAVAICKQEHPDIVVMDIGLAGINGIETTQILLRNAPDTKVIMLSIYDDEASAVSAIRAGARAYVVKKASGGDLLEALQIVAKGGTYMSPKISDQLMERLRRVGSDQISPTSVLEILAPRELQVFRLIAGGNGSKDIAGILEIGVETVRSYRKTMMRKLGVNNIAGLTQIAVAMGVALPNAFVAVRKSGAAMVADSGSVHRGDEDPRLTAGAGFKSH